VRAAGIRKVNGNVVIDDRLFNTYTCWPDGGMSPIGVNENFLDITATPMRNGKAARLSYRPRTAAWHLRSTVKTAARGSAPSWQVTQMGPGQVTASGTVPAGGGPLPAGKIQAKPGNRIAFATPALGIAGASNLVGYIKANSGRSLVFANLINNIPLTAAPSEVFSIFGDQQLINEAIQQAY
jgi:D-alanyl-D-alanine carboxypeptidase